jgi:hypothetical protein
MVVPDDAFFSILGSPIFAARKGGYFYLAIAGTIHKMSVSNPTLGLSLPASNALSYAVIDSGIYYVWTSIDLRFSYLNQSTSMTEDIRTFTGATSGSVMPFRGDQVAVRVNGSAVDDGVWIYRNGKFRRIISAPLDAIYSR